VAPPIPEPTIATEVSKITELALASDP
jgi:hypothetical protein